MGRIGVAEQSTGGISHIHLLGALRQSLKASGSLLAIGCLLASAPAFAQEEPAPEATPDTTEEDGEVIVVTGIRASLANSQDIKRDSDTVVDAITAEDIGALPDRSVTEALQR